MRLLNLRYSVKSVKSVKFSISVSLIAAQCNLTFYFFLYTVPGHISFVIGHNSACDRNWLSASHVDRSYR